ncbi:hypothetical protein D3C84_366450 [compost metagenome]
MAAHIGDDDPIVSGQHRDLVFPVLAAGAEPVNQDERFALAIFLIVQRASIVFEKGHGTYLSGLWWGGEGGIQRRGIKGTQQLDENLRRRAQGFVFIRVQVKRGVAAATLVQR